MSHQSPLNDESTSCSAKEAKRSSLILKEVRSLYTPEVVSRVTGHGVVSPQDYDDREGAIPRPATFHILLGERMKEVAQEVHLRLYSDYPFPMRTEWRAPG